MRKKRRLDRPDEPSLPEEGWYDYGDESLSIVGRTQAGSPQGPTRTEIEESLGRDHAGARWARAHTILSMALASRTPQARIEIGRVTKVGQGLSRDVFAAAVEVSPDPGALSGPYAVLLPTRGADPSLDERTEREFRLLDRLAQLTLPLRVPRAMGVWPDQGRLALVRGFLPGVELDLRAGRQPSVRPWEVVGQLAAAVHSLDVETFAGLLPGHETRRAHAEEALLVFEELDAPEARAALAWARGHLPPDAPSVLLHGDLLGQNILLAPADPPGLVDWEYARRGDPAYDLAIVTRGVRRPFQIERGMERLLEAYTRLGGCPVEASHVHVFELSMAAAWYRESLESRGGEHKSGEPPEQALARLKGILRRLRA
jgi:aminoglycoside phosphotransferase (APT) family kinase protein